MRYRTIPKTDDQLSILGYGCMRLPEKNGRIDKPLATRQIYTAIDQGINYVDTGFLYHMGQSEPFLGEVLTGQRRQQVKLATKLPPQSVKTRADMDTILNNQLQRLKTDRIDYYLLHGIEEASWNYLYALDVLTFLDKAKADGRIVNAGFSFHGDRQTFTTIVDAYDWQCCLIQYNYLDEQLQAGAEGIEYAAAQGLGVIVMEPLRGGTLTGKIPQAIQALWNGATIKRSPAEWALRWVWNHPGVTVVLSGMNVDAHIQENLRLANDAAPNALTPDELALIGKVTAAYRAVLKAGCTGCRYCMPCPAGVDIPMCLDLYNRVASYGDQKLHNLFRYGIHLGGMQSASERAYASQCINCGQCVQKCPQHLPIPELLPQVAREFETIWLQLLMVYARMFFYPRLRKQP